VFGVSYLSTAGSMICRRCFHCDLNRQTDGNMVVEKQSFSEMADHLLLSLTIYL